MKKKKVCQKSVCTKKHLTGKTFEDMNLRMLLYAAIVATLFVFSVPVRAEYGDWRVYAAYHNATKVVEVGERLFVLSDGGLYSYDPEDFSVETYDKASVLSDNGIFDIQKCGATGELVVVYTNGNVDLLDEQGECYNMPELKNKPLSDKTINEVSAVGEFVYVSTNSGIIVLNVSKRVVVNYYNLGQIVLSATEDAGHIYAATKNGVFRGDKSLNLLDASNWKKLSDTSLGHILLLDGNFYALTNNAVYRIKDKSDFSSTKVLSGKYTSYSVIDGKLFLFNGTKTTSVDAGGSVATYTVSGVSHMTLKGGVYWAACGKGGLRGYKLNASDFEETVQSVIPNSPVRNYSYKLSMTPEGRLLVAGGAFNYPDVNYDGTLMKYEGGEWFAFDETKPVELVTQKYYRNLTDLVQDPSDSEHHFASAARSGLYEFRNYELVNHYTYNNSPITSILPNDHSPGFYARVTSLNYDDGGNLWMCNTECDTIIRVLMKDGKWAALYYNVIAGYPTFDHTLFDRRGWTWINSRRSTPAGHKAGVFILDTNGTLADTSDDTYKLLSSFYNQDGTPYAPDLFNCMVEDLEGAIWFGTNLGLFVSYNPADAFKSGFYLSQVKVPRNDGTNLADYLLNGVNVRCVAIDGGNRKWVGTSGNGVYLISSDGMETLEHFTVNNSPLISNDINSIAIDGQTGEVFIATAAGLVSFMSNATDPVEKFDSDLVKVYPNPVRPDYQGLISITGLMYNSNVKIVNAAGRLVHEGTSVGGEYTWNGRLASGKRAASGIYYVLATDEAGEEGVAGKFLIVK